ncbi:hypothetical protein K438DRAFT_26040 [Mycena galopus ATCC 62051]|nr:hypothetical protein K438DRAFT_26040 [Mycena galopus ATCC 62051]
MAGTNMSLLTLRQVGLEPSLSVRYLVDTRDDSALSGIASFGGVWTFVNGAFALFFGANVIYFLFGRRPLSALGVVHVFQRAALVRQWNDDFPVIHTEGGLPGSERAGIVAFIRERLVDLGEDPLRPTCDSDDIEAQNNDHTSANGQEIAIEHEELSKKHTEYQLDEIPLMDIDLGLGGKHSGG